MRRMASDLAERGLRRRRVLLDIWSGENAFSACGYGNNEIFDIALGFGFCSQILPLYVNIQYFYF
jgi:hypothetical protein